MQYFVNDYMEGAYPLILEKMLETNFNKEYGYGADSFCESASKKIKESCGIKDGEVYFLSGGTQTNATVISGILRSYEGVISARTGHIAVHEAGIIEKGGHKIFELEDDFGKLSADRIKLFMENFEKDANKEHMVLPAMVYISQPTEYGTLYKKDELCSIREVCDRYGLKLFIDGARLGYALASDKNDLSLKDIASMSDVFYIGGTKCGALLGEAIVFPQKNKIPHFITIIKQNGALMSKSRNIGIQFDVLFTDDLYVKICKNGVDLAMKIKQALINKGYSLFCDSYTNQQFIIVSNEKMKELSKNIAFAYMEAYDENSSVIRLCTSWASKEEAVDKLIELL